MNIGFLYGLDISAPKGGGGNIHGHFLADALVERGHKLFSWYVDNGPNRFCAHLRGRQLLQFLRRIDVLYVRVEWNLAAITRVRILKRFCPWLPVVWEFNGHPSETLYASRTEEDLATLNANLRRLSSSADVAICVAEEIAAYIKQQLDIKNIFCIPNASAPDIFKPAFHKRNKSGPLCAVWIGTSRAGWHDLSTIFEAAQILLQQNANVLFKIYGDPSPLQKDLPPNVIACGELSYHDLGVAVGEADVGLHFFNRSRGASVEGSPMKIFDYMAAGLALVTEGRGQRGAVIDRWNCGVKSTGAPADIAKALEALEQDRQTCRQLGENGRKAVLEYFNWRRVAEETEVALDVAFDSKR